MGRRSFHGHEQAERSHDPIAMEGRIRPAVEWMGAPSTSRRVKEAFIPTESIGNFVPSRIHLAFQAAKAGLDRA